MLAERREALRSAWLSRACGFALGFGLAAVPAMIILAMLAAIIPWIMSLGAVMLAYLLYYVSLPMAAFLFRYGLRGSTLGFACGVVVSTFVVIFLGAAATAIPS